MDFGEGSGKPSVALIFCYRHTAGICDEEITPRYADIGRGVLFPKEFTGFQRQLLGRGRRRGAKVLVKQ